MSAVAVKGRSAMDMKKVSISSKRQITIPQRFYSMLGFDTEAECLVRGNELIIRPVKVSAGGEFAEEILADLIAQGYSGEELLNQFRSAQKKIRPAVEQIIEEAERAAASKTEYASYEDVFGEEDRA